MKKTKNLRVFYKDYTGEVLKIHEKYFPETPEQKFEGDGRGLVEAKCREKWEKFLKQKAYTLLTFDTTNSIPGKKTGKKHALDCYVELLHNGTQVARGFGEAKNYELLSSHLRIFSEWLDDFEFNPSPSDNTPPDLAFMIAPSCPSLLEKKLKSKNIEFIQANKEKSTSTTEKVIEIESDTRSSIAEQNIEIKSTSSSDLKTSTAVNINTGNEAELIATFKGLRIRSDKKQKLIKNRKNNPYKDLTHLASDLKFGKSIKAKLQEKLDNGEICF